MNIHCFLFLNLLVKMEMFTDCYHIVYEKLHLARKAKKILDAKVFYGGK